MNDDERLSDLFSEAVSDVEPAQRLDEIRSRTQAAGRGRRARWYAAGGTALVAAAAVTAIAVLGQQNAPRADDPAVNPSVPAPTTPSKATDDAAPDDSGTAAPEEPSGPKKLYAAYYLGDTPQGPRLYREFDRVGGDPLQASLDLVQQAPSDPDYRTPWPAGSLDHAGFDGIGEAGEFSVVLSDQAWTEAPAGMSAEEARLAVQALVYTLQANAGKAPVQFYVGQRRVDSVLGVSLDAAATADPQLDVLALVSISDPAEGISVSGSFMARGRANSFEANVPWELRDSSGAKVGSGFATAEGFGDHLYAWKTEVDVSDLAPGTYTFVAMTDDPSGGEGTGPDTDTRTVVVE